MFELVCVLQIEGGDGGHAWHTDARRLPSPLTVFPPLPFLPSLVFFFFSVFQFVSIIVLFVCLSLFVRLLFGVFFPGGSMLAVRVSGPLSLRSSPFRCSFFSFVPSFVAHCLLVA